MIVYMLDDANQQQEINRFLSTFRRGTKQRWHIVNTRNFEENEQKASRGYI